MYSYMGRIGKSDDVVVMYSVYWKSPTEIAWIDCHIQAAANAVSLSELKSVATAYLGFVATLPYSGSQPDLAKKWVVDTIQSTNKPSKYMTRNKFGSVYFYLDPYFIIQTPNSPKLIDVELTSTPNTLSL